MLGSRVNQTAFLPPRIMLFYLMLYYSLAILQLCGRDGVSLCAFFILLRMLFYDYNGVAPGTLLAPAPIETVSFYACSFPVNIKLMVATFPYF